MELPATPDPETVKQRCFDLLDAIDQQRIAEAEERGWRWPARLANDDLVGTCVASVQQGYDLETVVGWFADIDFSTNLNKLAAGLSNRDSVSGGKQTSGLSQSALSGAYTLLGFKCTGSMEPTISCEDQAYGTPPSAPEDIAIGDIISFDSPGDCLDGSIVHRVVAIEVVDGAYSYQTQGDAVDEPDACLVPFTAIDYLVVSILSDADDDPRKAQLRDRVNAASAAADTAEDAYIAAREEANRLAVEADTALADVVRWREATEAARDEYHRLVEENDAAQKRAEEAWERYQRTLTQARYSQDAAYAEYVEAHAAWVRANDALAPAFAEWDQAHSQWEQAFDEWEPLYSAWERAHEHASQLYAGYESAFAAWECWIGHARNDNYDAGC